MHRELLVGVKQRCETVKLALELSAEEKFVGWIGIPPLRGRVLLDAHEVVVKIQRQREW